GVSPHSALLGIKVSDAQLGGTRADLMLHRSVFLIALLFAGMLATGHAYAHPHVWVTMTEELLYAPDGSVTGVRNAWTFDDMFSAFATQGIAQKNKGTFTRAELAALAQVNIESLKDYGYFTYAKANGKNLKDAFLPPTDFFLDYDPKAAVLTLHFTMPFKTPVKAKTIEVEIYDEEFFIDFGFDSNNPVRLVGDPGDSALLVEKPDDDHFPVALRHGQDIPLS